MEQQPEMFWAPIDQAEQGLYGFLGDLQLSITSGSPSGLQIENYEARHEDAVLILQLLEGPQDEANLNDLLSGDLHTSQLLEAVTDNSQGSLHMKNTIVALSMDRRNIYRTFHAGDLHASPLLEAATDNSQGDLHTSPLLDTNADYQTKCRRSGRRGTRKRRTSPWNPMFIESRVDRERTSRKNNPRWTAKEVKRLVEGVSELGVGRWTKLKRIFFRTSNRTAENLKDKWRNLLKAYQGNSQKTTLLYLEPSLVEQIRKLAVKPNKRHK